MRKISFFHLLFAVEGRKRTPECFLTIDSKTGTLGDLTFETLGIDTCENLLEAYKDDNGAIFASCDSVVKNRNNFDVKCELAQDLECRDGPTGCGEGVKSDETVNGNSVKYCNYECESSTLPDRCESDGKYPHTIKDKTSPSTKLHCFDQSYELCEFIDPNLNTTNQIESDCSKRSCGYSSTAGFEFVFDDDKKEITNSFDAGLNNDPTNLFTCTSGSTPTGCTCDYVDTNQVTSMTCGASFYENKCKTKNCVNNKCYKGQPITDFGYDNCALVNEDLLYCKRDVKAVLPCGDNLKHSCSKNVAKTAYECTCTDETGGNNPCPVPETDSVCKISNLPIEEKMADCTKRTCFDIFYMNKATCPATFDETTLWQCFDNFHIIQVSPDTSSKNFKAIKTAADLDQFQECLVNNGCIEGGCECEDTEISYAKNHCGESFVAQKTSPVNDASEEIISSLEFQCLSYSDKKVAINDMNSDVDGVSECRELKPPVDPLANAKCPSEGNCQITQNTETNNAVFGFYGCECEQKCTYECNGKHYDEQLNATVPDNWDKENDENIYATYTCKKDNTIMIICTSIFVPLGVAGIAAGVYFFFFHESSEVAPVETDNELASTESREHDQVEQDKEETHSEVAKDN